MTDTVRHQVLLPPHSSRVPGSVMSSGYFLCGVSSCLWSHFIMHAGRWIATLKFPVGVKECVNVCVHDASCPIFPVLAPDLSPHPDQDITVTEDEWIDHLFLQNTIDILWSQWTAEICLEKIITAPNQYTIESIYLYSNIDNITCLLAPC